MRKPVIGADGSVGAARSFADEDFISRWPTLYAWLTDVRWDDGTSRETGTVLLCVDAGCLKAWLNDRALGLSAWVTSDTLVGLLDVVEGSMRDETVAWRRNPSRGRR